MTAAGRFWLAYAAVLAIAIVLTGCSTTPSNYSAPPYVGADCITTTGALVTVVGEMPGGWWWIKGDGPAWLVQTHYLARCI